MEVVSLDLLFVGDCRPVILFGNKWKNNEGTKITNRAMKEQPKGLFKNKKY
jgi:hypothetical protein